MKFLNGVNYWAGRGLEALRLVPAPVAMPTDANNIGNCFLVGNLTNNIMTQAPITFSQISQPFNVSVQTQNGIPVYNHTIIQPAYNNILTDEGMS